MCQGTCYELLQAWSTMTCIRVHRWSCLNHCVRTHHCRKACTFIDGHAHQLECLSKHVGCRSIAALLHPAGTVMDINIGAALWLAVRARGRLLSPHPGPGPDACGGHSPATPSRSTSHELQHAQQAQQATGDSSLEDAPPAWGRDVEAEVVSRARVVLLGHGADEAFGGYGRHRTRFREGGWSGLQAELELDMARIWRRNLGRDDRLVADLSREARHPFLDEDLLCALGALPLWLVCRPDAGAGGDKLLLRQVATRLGLPRAAQRAKRAIQFGSRIGRAHNIRTFGSNRAANRRHAGGVPFDAAAAAAAADVPRSG
eukprot:jgi/Ulvmu1/9680/UM055_0018.1